MDRIKYIESSQVKKGLPQFRVGDTVKVLSRIMEEGKTRLQAFEGTVIRLKGSGLRKNVTIRRISYGEGVEKTFPLHSPSINSIKVMRKGKVRRAKLYYLRDKIGKKTKVEGEDIFEAAPDASVRKEST